DTNDGGGEPLVDEAARKVAVSLIRPRCRTPQPGLPCSPIVGVSLLRLREVGADQPDNLRHVRRRRINPEAGDADTRRSVLRRQLYRRSADCEERTYGAHGRRTGAAA